MQVLKYRLGPLDNNTYLLVDEATRQTAIIDPSFDSRKIWETIQQEGYVLTWVLNTHAHIDHVVENRYFVGMSGAPLALHPDDQPLLDNLAGQAKWMGIEPPLTATPTHALAHEEVISIGESTLKVVSTPGHSPGSVSFLGEGFAIAGDALFAGCIGRTDLPGGNYNQLIASIRTQLLSLPDETRVYPGHGEETSIGEERANNPYLLYSKE